MNTPEGNKRSDITVRRKLANGLSIVALGVSSAMGVGGCSGIKEGKTYPQETQTQSTQGELTEQNTIMIPSRPTEGDYTPEQMERIQSGEFSDQENAYENWTRYWGAAENGPFRPETKDLRYKYLFDGEENCFVLLEASGEGREGKLFALPIKDGLFMEAPPEIPNEGFDIPEGFGPLMLAGSVAYRDGGLVRLDENGNVSERLNLETARWEREITLSTDLENLSTISIEDFTSGKLQDAESAWIEKNNPFSGREIFSDKIIIVRNSWGYSMLTFNCNNRVLMESYLADRSTFPAKIISYYKMQLPEDFFPHPENPKEETDLNDLEYFLVSQTWLNPNGSYTTLHYLFWNEHFRPLPNNKSGRVPVPLYEIKNLEKVHDSIDMTILYYLDVKKYMNYSDSPKPYLDEWLNDGNLPKELENFIFPPYNVMSLDYLD